MTSGLHSGARVDGSGADQPPFSSVLRGERDPSLERDEVLSELFTATARQRPYHPAIVARGRRMTYAQVEAAADAIARGLIRRGVGPGDVVGLWMPRGADLLVAQIAITKSGAAWLPFDAEVPRERIALCLADAGAIGLLSTDAWRASAGCVACEIWTDANLVDASDTRPVDPRPDDLTRDHPAYIIYTSGSTGIPKGIVVSHGNICHYLRAANRVFGFHGDDLVFQGA